MTVMDVEVQTVVGGAVALECDFTSSNPPPEVQWYADGNTMLEEDTVNDNAILFLDGGRYLYIQALTAAQRMMRYHCEVNNRLLTRAPTTYTLNTDLVNVGLAEYKGLGSKTGRVGEHLRFVYVATNRNAAGDFEFISINCPSHILVTFAIGSRYIITATLTAEAENETEVLFTCALFGSGITLNTKIMGTIVVSSEKHQNTSCILCCGTNFCVFPCRTISLNY